ncbi:N-acetylmuramic acid 6-phosphate etherase [Holdemania sp. 1001095H_141210_F2]|uniref:N-acetylmuramic acid 6-phosphate etherase n=1 Tax=Holdemania sp. 1001095H_141210_F2 TaxID=2787149 RepID=UPI00189FA4A4|nr:N-acetylmuramic acid 6-phosphate etherase [Holdemania sp. 1001095H_141210_F2]
MSEVKLNHLTTERRNENTMNLDTLSTRELLEIMNEEDHKVPDAVREAIPEIEKAVQAIIKALRSGGRLIYMGAGTSGRLGVIDSAECMPTFGTTYEVVGLLAGGPGAFLTAVEGAEDDAELGKQDLVDQKLTEKDVVCGIAASGRTPYVIGGLDYARSIGATAVSVACNKNSEVGKHADVAIEVDAGPEVLTGSTRLKSGTCQKLILNMLSTASMVGYGKVYGNLMVDVKATNLKLIERSKRIIMMATDCDYETAAKMYEVSGNYPKVAIVMILTGCTKEEAEERLNKNEGFVRQAIK